MKDDTDTKKPKSIVGCTSCCGGSCECCSHGGAATSQGEAAAKPSAAEINREANSLAMEIATKSSKAKDGGPVVTGDSFRLI